MLVIPSVTWPLEGQDSVITCDHGKNILMDYLELCIEKLFTQHGIIELLSGTHQRL